MAEEEKKSVNEETQSEPKKEKKKRRDKPKKEKRQREGKFWVSTQEFFKGLWKFISFFLKIILAPFWYTVVLFVKAIKFLKERGDHPLTEKDKKYLSLIPALFFMMCISIIVIFLIFRYGLLDKIIEVLTTVGFWAAIGQFFTSIGLGIWGLLQIIFVTFLYEMIIQPFGNFMQDQNYYWATLIIIVLIILITGLGILIYHALKSRTIIKAIGRFFKKIAQYPKDLHTKIREKIILKHLVGEKYIKTMSKNFFWGTVLIQTILTAIIFVFSIVLGIYLYVIGEWVGSEILNYSLIVGVLMFLLIGIFSTWFFVRVLGIATKDSEKYTL